MNLFVEKKKTETCKITSASDHSHSTAMELTISTSSPPSSKAPSAIKDCILFRKTNWKNIGSHCDWRVQNEEHNVIVECTTVVLRVPDNLHNRSILVRQRLCLYLTVPFSSPNSNISFTETAKNKQAGYKITVNSNGIHIHQKISTCIFDYLRSSNWNIQWMWIERISSHMFCVLQTKAQQGQPGQPSIC